MSTADADEASVAAADSDDEVVDGMLVGAALAVFVVPIKKTASNDIADEVPRLAPTERATKNSARNAKVRLFIGFLLT
jgi:hypothetical protein